MMMTKNIFALVTCFTLCNLQAHDSDAKKLSTVTVNITAQVVTPDQAIMIFGMHAVQNPLEYIKQLIADHFNDFIFTIDQVTYIVQSQSSTTPVTPTVTPNNSTITTNITAQPVTPEEAAAIVAGAAALYFAENFTDNPVQFITAILNQSHNGFIFTIDDITYIIQS